MAAESILPTVAGILRSNRDQLGIALIGSLTGWGKYESEIADSSRRQDFAQRETVALVDYLSAYFATGDQAFRDLYIGEKLKQCYDPADDLHEAIERRRAITDADRLAYLGVVGPHLDASALAALETELRSIQALLIHPADKVCRVLLVGDCLFVDLLGFLTVPLMKAGIQLAATFVTSKLISQQHREIAEHQAKEFDLVFYSPLTYAFNIGFSQFQSPQAILCTPSETRAIVDRAKADIKSTLQLLQQHFSCPTFVHNSANLRRHDGSWREQLKTFITRPIRTSSRRRINEWLSTYLDGLNSGAQRQILLLDEASLLDASSEHQLSQYFYHNGLQHPAHFSQAIAPRYEEAIFTRMVIADKKVIICDLDNTLWHGTIGDGAVSHFIDRQSTLLTLRKKGFLLAVCSKNDAKNVHWQGALLCDDDFACLQINWDSKSVNIRRIAQILNLKTKDFIFIDDRPDERALVMEAMPEVLTLDADAPSTWAKLAVLATIASGNPEGDRTLTYKQRAERERFLSEQSQTAESGSPVDDSEALEKLQLKLTIRRADRKELSRVTELINRTNQFNMCGTRTTLQEVTRWNESNRHEIWVLEAQDRFGSMGTISVAVVEETQRGVEIPAFVLSCRVFGFGMEDALINLVKQLRPGVPIFGLYKETPHNEPCRRTYEKNGFLREGNEWVFRGGQLQPNVSWLSVQFLSK